MDEIKEFISKSIGQIKAGLPNDCGLKGSFDFEISVIAAKGTKGEFNLRVVEGGRTHNTQQIHKIRFSITDKKSEKENLDDAMTTVRRFINELKQLDTKKRRKK